MVLARACLRAPENTARKRLHVGLAGLSRKAACRALSHPRTAAAHYFGVCFGIAFVDARSSWLRATEILAAKGGIVALQRQGF